MLDDETEQYWVRQEKYYAIWEAMYVWGAYTSYWRKRLEFYTRTNGDPYYDMSVVFPIYRPRNWTLNQLVQDIQYMSLEAPNGITGAGMSGQISIESVLLSVSKAINKFFLDARIPYAVNTGVPSPVPGESPVAMPQNVAILHRCMWQDTASGRWYTLWRQDAWSVDRGYPTWTTEPGMPVGFSESEQSPLQVEIYPAPTNVGKLEAITVDTQVVDTTNAGQIINCPNEWIHAIKYAALGDLFSNESQNVDPLRAKYADTRYAQSIMAVASARSIIRATSSNTPMPIDSLAAIDSSMPYWRNQAGTPVVGGVMYDILAVAPISDTAYPITVDLCISAPIPLAGDEFVQLGKEDMRQILDYAGHVMTFKCGGKEFENTFDQYDGFMKAVEGRNQLTAAKIMYLSAVMGQAQKETTERPDKV